MNTDTWMEAYEELKPEIPKNVQPARPSLRRTLNEIGPLPQEALFLGVANDGLPVLINLHDHTPGPLLVVGDDGCGKTEFLKTVAKGASETHMSEDLQFGVITRFPDEWQDAYTDNCVGVFPCYTQAAEDFLLSLASWAHGNKTSKQTVLLFFDGLENMNDMDFDARQNLRWLFLRGPARRVWPIVSLSTSKMQSVDQWLDNFHTRIFGKVERLQDLSHLNGTGSNVPDNMFTVQKNNRWLHFWTPKA